MKLDIHSPGLSGFFSLLKEPVLHESTWTGTERRSQPRPPQNHPVRSEVDDLDFGSGGEPPRAGGVKLWQLIAFLTTLFAAHYLLVQATINSALKDFEMRSIGVNAAANMQMQDMQRRIGNLEQFDQTTITRMASQESSDRDLEKRLTLVEERQRQVMAKIGLTNH